MSELLCTCAAKSEADCCCDGVDWRSKREKQLEVENAHLYCLIDELRDYLKHDSHRCKGGACFCGLNGLMKENEMAPV